MITVDEALAKVFSLVAPLGAEPVALARAAGRVLAEDAAARRDQPPFDASAMDGYALRADEARPGASFEVIGESAAGHRFAGVVGAGQAVRIFTGAPVPEGADRVVIQEDVTREGARITLGDGLGTDVNIRARGGDFAAGERVAAPRVLSSADIALLAAMNVAEVTVARKPQVALISTGDELVMPGEDPGPDQIIASNTFGLKALIEAAGAEARILPIARDTTQSLETAFDLAEGADLVVTIGGASVGDYDIVGQVAAARGMEQAFYKVLMRPGKPLMAGRMGAAAMVGLPGNPVSAMVSAHVFLVPMIRAMLGLGAAPATRLAAPLACDVPEAGAREHFMRARLDDGRLHPAENQDSALLSVLARSDALLIRPAGDGPRRAGEMASYIPL